MASRDSSLMVLIPWNYCSPQRTHQESRFPGRLCMTSFPGKKRIFCKAGTGHAQRDTINGAGMTSLPLLLPFLQTSPPSAPLVCSEGGGALGRDSAPGFLKDIPGFRGVQGSQGRWSVGTPAAANNMPQRCPLEEGLFCLAPVPAPSLHS